MPLTFKEAEDKIFNIIAEDFTNRDQVPILLTGEVYRPIADWSKVVFHLRLFFFFFSGYVFCRIASVSRFSASSDRSSLSST